MVVVVVEDIEEEVVEEDMEMEGEVEECTQVVFLSSLSLYYFLEQIIVGLVV